MCYICGVCPIKMQLPETTSHLQHLAQLLPARGHSGNPPMTSRRWCPLLADAQSSDGQRRWCSLVACTTPLSATSDMDNKIKDYMSLDLKSNALTTEPTRHPQNKMFVFKSTHILRRNMWHAHWINNPRLLSFLGHTLCWTDSEKMCQDFQERETGCILCKSDKSNISCTHDIKLAGQYLQKVHATSDSG